MQRHKIEGVEVYSDGESGGKIVFELEDGKQAVISASLENAPPKPEWTPFVEEVGRIEEDPFHGQEEERAAAAERERVAEEAAKETPKGRLPADFPHLSLLHGADPAINTYGQLRKALASKVTISGVPEGGERMKAIEEALAGVPQTDDED